MERITLNSALARFNGAQLTGDQRLDLINRGKVLVAECAGRAHNEALTKAGREDLIGYGPDCLLRPIRPVKAETPEKKGVKVDRKNGKSAPKSNQKGRGERNVPTRQGKAPTKKKR